MHILQHSLLAYINDPDSFMDAIPYVLLPDTVRCWTKDRKYSHFEWDSSRNKKSYMMLPNDLSLITPDWCRRNCHSGGKVRNSVLGGETSLEKFKESNRHLFQFPLKCYETHLIQDIAFDEFIRTYFYCGNQFDDKFMTYGGMSINGKELREIIYSIEQYGISVLIEYIKLKFNVTIDQNWINKNIIDVLKRSCHMDLVKNSMQYLQLDEIMIKHPKNIKIDLVTEDEHFLYKVMLLDVYRDLGLDINFTILCIEK